MWSCILQSCSLDFFVILAFLSLCPVIYRNGRSVDGLTRIIFSHLPILFCFVFTPSPLRLYVFTLLYLFAFTPFRLYVITSLRLYAFMPFRLFAFSPFRLYTFSPLHLFAITPFRLYAFTPLCLFAITPLISINTPYK